MFLRTICAFVVFGLIAAHALSIEPTNVTVGDLGSPSRLSIVGAKSFPTDQIRRALFEDLEVANAAYRTDSLRQFMDLLVKKLLEGYLVDGFFDVRASISITPDASGLVLTVDEGRRFRAGGIKVTGNQTIDAESLRKELLPKPTARTVDTLFDDATGRPFPDKGSALTLTGRKGSMHWCPGEPAVLDQYNRDHFQDTIAEALFHQGRLFVDFDLKFVPDRKRDTIDLVIVLNNEGRPATIDQIVFPASAGKSRHEDVLSLCGLARGVVLTEAVLQKARKRFSGSARFAKADITVRRPRLGQPLVVVLDYEEYKQAPPLDRALSAEELALEKLGQWMQDFSDSTEELVVEDASTGIHVEFVAAPRSGILVEVYDRAADRATAPPVWAFVMTEDRVGLYSGRRRSKLEARAMSSPFWLKVGASLHGVGPDSGKDGKLVFGLGMTESPVKQHVRFNLLDTPSSTLAFAYENGSRIERHGRNVAVSYGDKRIEFDAESGRLLNAVVFDDPKETARLRTEVGAFERQAKQLDSWAASWDDLSDPRRPMSAGLEFVFDDAIAALSDPKMETFRDIAKAWRNAIAAGLLTPMDDIVRAASQEDDSEFYVPSTSEYVTLDNDSTEMIAFMFSRMGITRADQLFERDGWAWTLFREAMFRLAGRSRHFHEELGRQFAHQESGPLRNLCAALVLRQFGMAIESRVAAQQGLARMTIEDFRRDYLAITSTETFLGRVLQYTVGALGQLNDDDLRNFLLTFTFLSLLDVPDGVRLAVCVKQVAAENRGSPETLLPNFLDAFWVSVLRERCQKIFTDIDTGSASSPPANTTRTARTKGSRR